MKTQGKIWIIYDAENKSQSKPLSVVQAQVVLLSIQPHNFSRYFLWTPGWEKWTSLRDFIAADQTYFVIAHPPKPAEDEATQATFDKNTVLDKTATHPASELDKTKLEEIASALNQNYSAAQDQNAFTEVEDAEPMTIAADQNYGYWHHDFHGSELDLSKIKKIKPPEVTTKKKAEKEKTLSGADRRKEERHNFKIEVVLVSKSRSFRTYSRNISTSGTMLDKEIPKEFLKKQFDLIIVNPFEPNSARARLLFKAKIVGDLSDPRRLMFIEQDPMMTSRLTALLKAYVTYQAQMKKTAV